MEEDRASRSRVSIVCGRAEREEQGGEYRRMAEQARGRIRGVYEGEKDRRTIPYTYGTFVLFAHCRTRVYRIQRHTPPCDLLPRHSSNRRTISGNLYLSNLLSFLLLTSKDIQR